MGRWGWQSCPMSLSFLRIGQFVGRVPTPASGPQTGSACQTRVFPVPEGADVGVACGRGRPPHKNGIAYFMTGYKRLYKFGDQPIRDNEEEHIT
jgi:hypothetical protein